MESWVCYVSSTVISNKRGGIKCCQSYIQLLPGSSAVCHHRGTLLVNYYNIPGYLSLLWECLGTCEITISVVSGNEPVHVSHMCICRDVLLVLKLSLYIHVFEYYSLNKVCTYMYLSITVLPKTPLQTGRPLAHNMCPNIQYLCPNIQNILVSYVQAYVIVMTEHKWPINFL